MHTRSFIYQVNLIAVQYFNPAYAPAEHDDFTQKMTKLECQTPSRFYQKLISSISSKELLQCLNSIESGTALYNFSFQSQPRLILDPDEPDQPVCLKKLLPELPLPREIYFLGRQEIKEPLQCYSASFNTQANKILDADFLSRKLNFMLSFPISRELKNDRDLLIWLMVTTFDLLSRGLDGGGKQIHADVVPEQLCRQCFENDPYFEDKKSEKIPPALWNDQ